MSSVESILPMFGVNAVVFHGSGLPYIGMPVTIACPAPRPTGAGTTPAKGTKAREILDVAEDVWREVKKAQDEIRDDDRKDDAPKDRGKPRGKEKKRKQPGRSR